MKWIKHVKNEIKRYRKQRMDTREIKNEAEGTLHKKWIRNISKWEENSNFENLTDKIEMRRAAKVVE